MNETTDEEAMAMTDSEDDQFSYFDILPEEILLKILAYLPLGDLHKNVALVSKKMLTLTRSPYLFKNLKFKVKDQFHEQPIQVHHGLTGLEFKLLMCTPNTEKRLFKSLKILKNQLRWLKITNNYYSVNPLDVRSLSSLTKLRELNLSGYHGFLGWTSREVLKMATHCHNLHSWGLYRKEKLFYAVSFHVLISCYFQM